MQPSPVSSTGRAAASLCAACRRQALEALATRGAASRAALSAAAGQSALRAVGSPPQLRSIPSWASQIRSSSSSSSSSGSGSTSTSTSSSPSPSSPPIPTYYALFPETLPEGPPPAGKFAIDLRALRREFLRLQAASHPDFHHHAASASSSSSSASSSTSTSSTLRQDGNKSPARLRAEATSALINQAYKTLSSPLLRAQYLLRELHGVDLEAEGPRAAAGTGTGTGAGNLAADPDPDTAEVLATVLEAREAIDEAEREEDLEPVRAANEARIAEAEAAVGEALERGDVPGAAREAVRLKYWLGIREGVDSWERGKPVVLQH